MLFDTRRNQNRENRSRRCDERSKVEVMEGLLRVLATWDVIVVAPGLGNASFRGLKVQLSDSGSWCILPVSGFEQVTIPDVFHIGKGKTRRRAHLTIRTFTG